MAASGCEAIWKQGQAALLHLYSTFMRSTEQPHSAASMAVHFLHNVAQHIYTALYLGYTLGLLYCKKATFILFVALIKREL